jgi:hypothetical protein
MGKRYPKTHILHSLRNKNITASIAVAEFIDNSFVTANEFMFIIHPDCVMAADNGEGVSNLDDIFGLGYSENQNSSKNIGLFGIGSKDAQFFFGSRCKVQTVYQEEYYEDSIDWEQIEQSGDWGEEFDGHPEPIELAPPYIRNGGTLITITNLEKRRYNMEMLVKRLTQRFRPALLQGYKITIMDYRDPKTGLISKSPREYTLTESLSAIGLTGELTSIENLEVDGRKFSINYGTLQEADEQLSGVHFALGIAYPISKKNLTAGRILIPQRLWAEVVLSEDWKNSFAPNKEKLVRSEQELENVVLDILRPLIKELSVQSQHVRINHVNLALAVAFEDIIKLKPGEHEKGEEVKDEHIYDNGRKRTSHKPKDKGLFDIGKRKQHCGGIKFARNDNLGKYISSDTLFQDGQLTIELNGSIPIIDLAYSQPSFITDLWPIISREFANFCRKHIAEIDNILPHFVDYLDKEGYGIEPDYPDSFADKIFTFIMKQCPLAKENRQVA